MSASRIIRGALVTAIALALVVSTPVPASADVPVLEKVSGAPGTGELIAADGALYLVTGSELHRSVDGAVFTKVADLPANTGFGVGHDGALFLHSYTHVYRYTVAGGLEPIQSAIDPLGPMVSFGGALYVAASHGGATYVLTRYTAGDGFTQIPAPNGESVVGLWSVPTPEGFALEAYAGPDEAVLLRYAPATGLTAVPLVPPGPGDVRRIDSVVALGDELFFTVATAQNGPHTLYRHRPGDGVIPVPGPWANPVDLWTHDGELFVGDAAAGGSVYRFDGATASPVPGAPTYASDGTAFGDVTLVTATVGGESQLHVFDGAVFTPLDVFDAYHFVEFGGAMYFVGSENSDGVFDVWRLRLVPDEPTLPATGVDPSVAASAVAVTLAGLALVSSGRARRRGAGSASTG